MSHPALGVCLTASGQEQTWPPGLHTLEYAKCKLARSRTTVPSSCKQLAPLLHTGEVQISNLGPHRRLSPFTSNPKQVLCKTRLGHDGLPQIPYNSFVFLSLISSQLRPDRLWDPTSLFNGCQGVLFPGGKASGA